MILFCHWKSKSERPASARFRISDCGLRTVFSHDLIVPLIVFRFVHYVFTSHLQFHSPNGPHYDSPLTTHKIRNPQSAIRNPQSVYPQSGSPLPERILFFTPDFLSSASKISLMIGSSSSYSIRLPPFRILVLPSRFVRPPPPSARINHFPSPPHVGAI